MNVFFTGIVLIFCLVNNTGNIPFVRCVAELEKSSLCIQAQLKVGVQRNGWVVPVVEYCFSRLYFYGCCCWHFVGAFFFFFFFLYGLILEREDLDPRRTGLAFFLCPNTAEL